MVRDASSMHTSAFGVKPFEAIFYRSSLRETFQSNSDFRIFAKFLTR
jgi:hypothetical protein